MKMKISFIGLLIIVSQLSFGQDKFQVGYDLLESESYKEASLFFQKMLAEDSMNLTARICYGRALGLGAEKENALESFKLLASEYNDNLEVNLNLGEAYMWNNMYEEALVVYQSLLLDNPDHFVVNFGYANANASLFNNEVALRYINKAIAIEPDNVNAIISRKYIMISHAYLNFKSGNYKTAQQGVESILELYPNNPNALEMQGEILSKTNSVFSTFYSSSEDVAGNLASNKLFHSSLNINERHRTSLYFNIRNTENGIEQIRGSQRTIMFTDKINLGAKGDLELGLGSSSQFFKQQLISNNFIGRANLELFPVSQLYLRFGYTRQLHNYTSQLINQGISLDEYGSGFNLTILKSIGWYSNGSYTLQSDSNNRLLWTNSIYFILKDSPSWKFGINSNYISYSSDRSEFYFSPNDFRSAELFVDINNERQPIPFKYKLAAAVGGQKSSGEDQQSVARVECRIAYNFRNGVALSGSYLYSNAAQTTAVGAYSYNEWKVGLSYALKRQFQKKAK